jgi:hypothetical protein
MPQIALNEWLEWGTGIFHIAGNAGSGKSTLMKYLCDGEGRVKCKRHLQKWANDAGKTLLFAQYFFFRVTSVVEQKSLSGLLRTLLHAVLVQAPSLVEMLFPEQWEADEVFSMKQVSLSNREVLGAFQTLVTNRGVLDRYRLCFFIDGLDELEKNFVVEKTTHAGLARYLRQWTDKSINDVKMCVTSRPHPEFINAFLPSQRINLRNFTHDDIELLIINKLVLNPSIHRLIDETGGVEDIRGRVLALKDELLDAAKGEFL